VDRSVRLSASVVLVVAAACARPPARITAQPRGAASPPPSPAASPTAQASPKAQAATPTPAVQPSPSPTSRPTKTTPKPPSTPAPAPSPEPALEPAPEPTAVSYGGTQGQWGCTLAVDTQPTRRDFACSGMTPMGPATWSCPEASPNTWTCTGETGAGPGTWTWALRDSTRQVWDGYQPTQYPSAGGIGCGSTDIPFNLRCNFLLTSGPVPSQIDYTWTGDVNTYRYEVKGDAGFGAATWSCLLTNYRIDCSGQVGLPWITSPFPVLYNPSFM
jgi:hypothetical protein